MKRFALRMFVLFEVLSIVGCGAFADVVDEEVEVVLRFDKEPTILQGKTKQFVISFSPPPPWKDRADATSFGYLTGYELAGDDLTPSLSYDGQNTIQCILTAFREAVVGERSFTIRAAYGPNSQGERMAIRGTGTLYVFRDWNLNPEDQAPTEGTP